MKRSLRFSIPYIIFMNSANATILPKSYPMLRSSSKAEISLSIKPWLSPGKIHSNYKDDNRIDENKSSLRDILNRQFFDVIHSKNENSHQSFKVQIDSFAVNILRVPRPRWKEIPLMPYFIQYIISNTDRTNSEKDQLATMIHASSGGFSCPSFDLVKKRLQDRTFVDKNPLATKAMLRQLGHLRNPKPIESIIDRFAKNLDKNQWNLFQGELRMLIERHPTLNQNRHLQVFKNSESAKTQTFSSIKFDLAIRKRQCFTARKILNSQLKTKKQILSFDSAKDELSQLSKCYRRKGANSRLKMLKQFSSPFEGAFSLDGWAHVNLDISRFHWNRNHFDLARASLDKVTERSRSEKHEKSHADSLYLRARIDENEDFYQKAIEGYSEFLEKFPDHKSANDARRALVLNYSGLMNWPRVLSVSADLITKLNNHAEIENSTSLIGFARFWAGRAALEMGRKEQGLAYWQIASNESFSTYYGAMSHYMLEKWTGKIFRLQPSYTTKFNLGDMLKALPDEISMKFYRAQDLLDIGWRKQASCEINDLAKIENNESITFLRSLFLNQTGEWLAAIKAYGSLSREFRKSLPFGSERVLFPKKYDDTIGNYSSRLGLDPDLIFSLIRQESVFNPRAHSHAGAKGLMQLLRRTARVEARRLPRAYVSRSKKRQLLSKVKQKRSLFEVEANIILGTHYFHHLLNRYNGLTYALAAYNAGPTVVNKWIKKNGSDDPLYFIERIPYGETRSYVKLILRNYFYYKKWYRGANIDFPQLADVTDKISGQIFKKQKNTSQLER